jgi:hypothetical protein
VYLIRAKIIEESAVGYMFLLLSIVYL